MKKYGILNSHISEVLSSLGHTDIIVIADCGLPVPDGVRRIDLSLKLGTPGFKETLMTILEDMAVEKVTIAEEMSSHNPDMLAFTMELFEKDKVLSVPHQDFKKATATAKAIIRTGEASPYANIILHSGVIF